MATRPSRTADTGTVPQKASTEMPAAWGTGPVEEFSGHDLTDKKELEGVPFLIIGAEIERNENRGYDIAYIYALDVHGTEFEFSDTSSTGVRPQMQAILLEQELNPAPDGGYQPLKVRVACMKGLRVSPFEFEDEKTGKTRDARVYYLSGRSRAHS